MDSPSSGFRRAAAASWALMGLGVAGVAGASALAYVDTIKPPLATAAVESAPPQVVPLPVLPPVSPPIVEPPPAPDVPMTTVEPAPEPQYTPVPEHTPVPQYTEAPQYTPAPKPSATTPPTTKRRLAPTTVMAPNYSPHITVSRGS